MPRMFSASYQRYSTSDGGTEGRGDAGTLLGSKILRNLRCAVRPNKNMPIRASRRLISSNLSTRTTFLKRERVVGFSAFLWSIALYGRSCERVDEYTVVNVVQLGCFFTGYVFTPERQIQPNSSFLGFARALQPQLAPGFRRC